MEPMSEQRFSLQDLDDINLGAHFFACGGGGSLENGRQLLVEAKNALQKRGVDSIQYLEPEDVADGAWLPVLAAMGAPQEFMRLGYGKSPVGAFLAHQRIIQNRLGNPDFSFSSVVAVETGSIAHTMTLLVAATQGLPVVDGDGGGRAFPSLQMATFANPATEANIRVSPCALVSEEAISQGGASLAIDCHDASVVDNLSRSVISGPCGFGDRASLSSFAMTGAQLKQPDALVHGTLTRARDLGRGLRECEQNREKVFAYLERTVGARVICTGTVTAVESETRGGFDWLNVHIEGSSGEEYVVVAKNENIMIWSTKSDTPLALAPDLICYIQPDGKPLSNDEINTNFTPGESFPIAVVALRAPEPIDNAWFHQQFGEVFRAYGYYGAYHPPVSGSEGA